MSTRVSSSLIKPLDPKTENKSENLQFYKYMSGENARQRSALDFTKCVTV